MLGNQDPAHGWAQQWGDSPAPPIGGGNGSWAEQPTSQKYLLTVFWAIGLISASARGDITPTTNAELVFVILCEVGGCVVFGLVLARKMLPPSRLDCLLTICLKQASSLQRSARSSPPPGSSRRKSRGKRRSCGSSWSAKETSLRRCSRGSGSTWRTSCTAPPATTNRPCWRSSRPRWLANCCGAEPRKPFPLCERARAC